ncbi:hypothetical protein HAP41_0000005305 [Bradyrhizobium barranii subsp. apii]|uniref:Uncharacterized protein n=1 Tax=Bradyrhizobium barranii subsp. apii TaxID=2819348 RepID=A0A8T5VGM5_9BRAD|nr:hypothetical protein [Bradyrhizobium barranii]UPT88509.1 hypothetical protein HAP41_0000005305 [Bradyrhizobium barranii subsp. apii]
MSALPARPLAEADRIAGFRRATCSMAGAKERWRERSITGLSNQALAEALSYELGIFGGCGGPDCLSLTYKGAGLKIWISWETHNSHQMKPTFSGETTIAMARLVYGVRDSEEVQLALF